MEQVPATWTDPQWMTPSSHYHNRYALWVSPPRPNDVSNQNRYLQRLSWAPRSQSPCVQSDNSSLAKTNTYLAAIKDTVCPHCVSWFTDCSLEGKSFPKTEIVQPRNYRWGFLFNWGRNAGPGFQFWDPTSKQLYLSSNTNSFYEQKKFGLCNSPTILFQCFSLAHSLNYWEKNTTSNCENFQKQYIPTCANSPFLLS